MTVADLVAKLSLKTDKSSFSAGDKLLTAIKRGIGAVVAFKTARWAKDLVNQTVDVASHFVDMAQQVGVGIEPLQQLGFAAEQSGVGLDSLGVGLKRLSLQAFSAAKGGKEAAGLFRGLGIAVKRADGSIRPAEDLLGDVADRIATLPDGTQKTALAMKVFGRSGAELIPLLNEGRAGIAKMRGEFVALGGQIDQRSAKQLEEFGDQTDKVKVALQGFRNQAVVALLPHMRALANTLLRWISANRDLIRQRIREFIDKLVIAAQWLWEKLTQLWDVAQKLWPTIHRVGEVIGSLVDGVGGAESAIKLMIAAWVAFKGLQLTVFLAELAAKLWAVAAASSAAGAAGGGIGGAIKGAAGALASFGASAGLVGLAGAAGAAAGFGIDKLVGLTGRSLSDRLSGTGGGDVRDPVHEKFKREHRVTMPPIVHRTATLADTGAFAPMPSPSVPANSQAVAGPVTVHSNPTITINAPNVTKPEQIAPIVKDAVREAIESHARNLAAVGGR